WVRRASHLFAVMLAAIAPVAGMALFTAPASAADGYVTLVPDRILDTRPAGTPGSSGTLPIGVCTPAPCHTLGDHSTEKVMVAGMGGVPPMGSANPPSAVVMNVTIVDETGPSYLTVWPDDASQPLASNLNWV